MNTQTEMSVHRSVTVPLSAQRSFELFTGRMTEFWPAEHSIGTSAIAEVVVEPEAGGRWYERGVDGGECQWGKVAEWNPPERVVLHWQIGTNWEYDPELVTEVEVTFTEEAGGKTRLDLTHRHLERYGEQAEMMVGIFGAPTGWQGTLTAFAELAGA